MKKKVLFDTNVLIAGMLEQHIHHYKAYPWLEKAYELEIEPYVASQSLLELYSILTKDSFNIRLSPVEARKMIHHNVEKITNIVTLNVDEYFHVLDSMEKLNIRGYKIYDAIIAYSGLKANVDTILTFNYNDFKKVIPDNQDKILIP